MKKYFIATGYGVSSEKAWVIAEVETIKTSNELIFGRFVKRLANYYFSGRKGSSTGGHLKWRFRDNAWECAALLIKIMFHDKFDPYGEEPWLKLKT